MPDRPLDRVSFRDLLLGPLVFVDAEAKLLNTAEMARLRGISQLAVAHLFYDNATHTRFQHSAGAAWRARFFIDALPTTSYVNLTLSDRLTIRSAALLHDIGHSAWSHVGERYARYRSEAINHDDLSAELVTDEDGKYEEHLRRWGKLRIRDVIQDRDRREAIAAIIGGKAPGGDLGKTWMAQLIHSELDVDRADYLSRDAFFTLATAQMLIDPLSAATKTGIIEVGDSKELGFLDLVFAESFILARELMYQAVYMESRKLVAEELLIRALLRGLPDINIIEFWFSVDAEILHLLSDSADPLVGNFLTLMRQRLTNSETYHIVHTSRFFDEEGQAQSNLVFLNKSRKSLLNLEDDVVKDARIPDGQMVLVVDVWKEPTGLGRVWIESEGKQPVELLNESLLLQTLLNMEHGLRRSKFIIAVHPDLDHGGRERAKESALKFIREEDLRQRYAGDAPARHLG